MVYCTRSLIEAENEGVVARVIEFINMMYQKKTPYRVAPPVIPLTYEDIEEENPVIGKYLRFMPSNLMSGCFIATITREVSYKYSSHFQSCTIIFPSPLERRGLSPGGRFPPIVSFIK